MTPPWTVRPPYADEMRRVLRMLPRTPEQHGVRVAVIGRVERIAAAAVLSLAGACRATGLLRFTATVSHSMPQIIPEVLAPLVEEARQSGAAEVLLVGSVAEEHPLATLLLQAGFEAYRETEVYNVDATPILDRVEAVYQRMVAREMIPSSARTTAPCGAWIPKLRHFLDQQQQTLAERLDVEEGYTLEHSLILLLEEEVKGAFFTRNCGRESYIGLMLLDPSLRGGLPWANTFMMRQMLQFGMSLGVERLVGEVHPEEHHGSRLLAHASGAKLICRRRQFRQQFTV